MGEYCDRVADTEIDSILGEIAALSVEGPKGVGKTRCAMRHAGTIWRLDDEGERAVAAADPGRLSQGRRPILIDEWQRLPASWDVVRRSVDDDPTPGRFLMTGSASPAGPSTHSGAGRIVTTRMRPMTLSERGIGTPTVSARRLIAGDRPMISGTTSVALDDYASALVASGFPGLLGLSERAQRLHLESYLDRVVDREFEEFGYRLRTPAALRRWLTAYAAATATTSSFETVRDAATGGETEKPAKTTTMRFRDVLERLFLVEPVPAWLPTRNALTRLNAAPKHHLCDPALAMRALGLGRDALLHDGALFGRMFESLVTLSLRVFSQPCEGKVFHLRTRGGEREVDLIVERSDRRAVAFEVKLTRAVTDEDVRGLSWLRDAIGDELVEAVIITTGPEAYRRDDGIAVVPLALLGP